MRILLINPPDTHSARISTGWDVSIGNIGRFPPLGLLALAAWLRKNPRFEPVRVIDAIESGQSAEQLAEETLKWNADVVGLTAFTYTWYDVLQVVKAVKRAKPSVRIVLGGPHLQLFPKETLSNPEIDAIVLGEGEEPAIRLFEAWDQGIDPPRIDGLGFRDQSNLWVGRPAFFPLLDRLPIPAYDLLDRTRYCSTFGRGGLTLTVASSRGCPYQCTFCQVLVRKYRSHSKEYLLNLVKWGVSSGYTQFYFFDDLFNLTARRVEEFAEGLKEANLPIQWVFRGRVDQVTDRMCQLARESGCVQMMFGVEAHRDADLKLIKKRIKMAEVRKTIDLARKHRIETSTNWIIALPCHASEADLQDMSRTVIRLRPDYAMFSILQLLPGCEMYEDAVRDGVLKREDWRNFALKPTPNFQIPFYDRHLPAKTQVAWYRKLHDQFYGRLGYILRRLLKLRSLEEFKIKARVGLHILGLD